MNNIQPECEIAFMQFGIMSPEEIRRYGVCEITNTKIRCPESENIYDPKMGPCDNVTACSTCGQKSLECPGHFGYIELEIKIIHPKFAPTILSILKCVCHDCSTLLIPPSHLTLYNIDTLEPMEMNKWMVNECKKIKSCPNEECQTGVVDWECTKECIFYMKYNESRREINTNEIYDILRKISNETMYLLGFNRDLSDNKTYQQSQYFVNGNIKHRHQIRPEWMIFTVLPVAPTCVRPCVNSSIDEKQDDDLSDKYVNICKLNEALKSDRLSDSSTFFATNKKRKNPKLNEVERKKKERRLFEEIATMFDNSEEKSSLSGGRPHKCFKKRLTGKEGHIRKNVEAKRTDFSARSVIDAGPTLEFHQVSVPVCVAEKMTFPIEVSRYNFSKCVSLLENDKVNYIIRGGRNIRIDREKRHARKKMELRIGDVIERHLQDGDWVIMNRQPTLRVESMNAHEVVIAKNPNEKVFRIHLSACNGYNADQ